jgi:hypothetical protein
LAARANFERENVRARTLIFCRAYYIGPRARFPIFRGPTTPPRTLIFCP